jgi:tryptophan synthase alpha chain
MIKKKYILSIYFTAGYPNIKSTQKILKKLQEIKVVDIIEIGLPYSDPLSDGIIIQNSSQKAIENGITIKLFFSQLYAIKMNKPLILMGYYNQFLKFGEERFLKSCIKSGISGLIFPDLPVEIYKSKYHSLFKSFDFPLILLATPKTTDKRILMISKITSSFLYLVSSSSTTGPKKKIRYEQLFFFDNIKNLNIPKLVGFGISNKIHFNIACSSFEGAIIGSEFLSSLEEKRLEESIENFLNFFFA